MGGVGEGIFARGGRGVGKKVVGAPGFEPGTFCTPSKRATSLRYAPTEGVSSRHGVYHAGGWPSIALLPQWAGRGLRVEGLAGGAFGELPDLLQTGRSGTATHGHLAFGAFPNHHGGDADGTEFGEFSLGHAKAFAQGANAFAGDPKPLGRGVASGDREPAGGRAAALVLDFFLQAQDLPAQVGNKTAVGGVAPLDGGEFLPNDATSDARHFRFQFFHHVGHGISPIIRLTIGSL